MDALKISRPALALVTRRQQGFVLVVALVIMIIMTLSSVAMIASLRGGISASANIAFRQSATRSADVAVDNAFQWVQTQMTASITALNSDIAPANAAAATTTPRYYATMSGADAGCKKDGIASAFTPQSYRFSDSVNGSDGFPCAAKVAGKPSGYDLYYVIHRMANTAAASCPAAGCLAPPISSVTGSSGSAGCSMDPSAPNFCGAATTTNQLVYYRITVKVVGPRQNNRYIQGFVY
jgi:type IV pilus assembly protein PilX